MPNFLWYWWERDQSLKHDQWFSFILTYFYWEFKGESILLFNLSSCILFLKVRTKDRVFDSISHLINHHLENNLPIVSSGSELCLQQPAERKHWLQTAISFCNLQAIAGRNCRSEKTCALKKHIHILFHQFVFFGFKKPHFTQCTWKFSMLCVDMKSQQKAFLQSNFNKIVQIL